MKFWLLLLAIPFLVNGEITWQADVQKPFALSLKLNSDQVSLDDFLYLDAEFHYPSSHELDVEALIDQLGWSANPLSPQLNVYQTTVSALKIEEDVVGQKLHTVIRPLVEGSIDLSFLNVSFQPKDKTKSPVTILTPVFTIKTTPIKEQKTLAYAPLIPLEPEFPLGLTEANRQFLWESPERLEADKQTLQEAIDRHTFPWAALAVLLGLGGIGWTAYLMRDYLPKPKRKEPPALSPKEQAEKALQELEKRKLLDLGQPKAQAAELTSILLTAMEPRAGRTFKELTTIEIGRALKDESSFSKSQKDYILSFLSETDQIKFAGKIPSSEEFKTLEQKLTKILFSDH